MNYLIFTFYTLDPDLIVDYSKSFPIPNNEAILLQTSKEEVKKKKSILKLNKEIKNFN